MKFKILLFIFMSSNFLLFGQDMRLKSSVIATAGNSIEPGKLNISKWRLGEVHTIVIAGNELNVQSEIDWKVSAFPNPFNQYLFVDFKISKSQDFTILVSDAIGKNQLLENDHSILPGQTIKMDLGHLVPGIYLLTIISKEQEIQRSIKIQKQ